VQLMKSIGTAFGIACVLVALTVFLYTLAPNVTHVHGDDTPATSADIRMLAGVLVGMSNDMKGLRVELQDAKANQTNNSVYGENATRELIVAVQELRTEVASLKDEIKWKRR